MKKYKELLSELPSKTVVVTFGQFNPPSVGHELMVKVVRKLASQRNADHFVFVSSVQDKKNPLEISKKIQYLETLFPSTRFIQRELPEAVNSLKKYKNVIVVTTADSMADCKKVFKKNSNVEFVQAGYKCPDSDDRLVKLATKGEYQNFKTALPTTSRELDGKRLMNDIRIGLNLEPIKEQINLVKDDLREQYFRGGLFSEGDIVESDNTVYKIIKRGSNHLLLQNEAGLKVSKWIQDVQLSEREFMLDEKQLQEADSTGATGLAAGAAAKEAKKAQLEGEKAKLAAAYAETKKKEAENYAKAQASLKQSQHNECKDSPVVDKNSKYNIAKSIMSLSDFRKSTGQMTKDETEIADKVHDGLVGNVHMGDSHGLRHQKIKHHLGEGNYDDNRTGFSKKPREDDEGHAPTKFKSKSTMDRPHTVHIDGKPWKKFDNGHQAHAAAKTLQAKGKKATAIAHFREETEEQKDTRDAQLKRFKDQAKDCKLSEAQYAGLEKEDKPGKKKTEMSGSRNSVSGETVEGWKDEDIGFKHTKTTAVKEEFEEITESEFDEMINSLTDEDILEAYEDSELAIIDEETGEEIEALDSVTEQALMEVLSRMERIKAKARMRRSAAKRERAEKIALRQFSSSQVANRRARRLSVTVLKKRLMKGVNPSKASVGQKENMERYIAQHKKVVDRLSARMVTKVRQTEKKRLSHNKFTKG